MSTMINKLKAIHRSRKEYKEELTDEQKRRLEICSMCSYNSDNYLEKGTIREKFYKLINKIINKFYGLKVEEDAVCLHCGCDIVFKTLAEDSENKCGLGKWE